MEILRRKKNKLSNYKKVFQIESRIWFSPHSCFFVVNNSGLHMSLVTVALVNHDCYRSEQRIIMSKIDYNNNETSAVAVRKLV